MAITYKEYLEINDEEISEIVSHLYNSPINVTRDIVSNHKRVSFILTCLGIFPGILYRLSKRNFVDNELADSYSQLISAFWKRLSSIQGHCGYPKISSVHNALVVEYQEYSSQKLEKIIESFQNQSIFADNKFAKPKFYDPSFKLLVEKLGIQDFFFSSDNLNGKTPANWENIINNAIYQEQLSSTTTKILFSYYDQLINVSNYATYSRAIVKKINDNGEKSFYVDNIINSRGFMLESTSTMFQENPFLIVSRDWDYFEDVYGMECIDDEINDKEFTKHFAIFAANDMKFVEIEDTINSELRKNLVEYQKTTSAFMIHFAQDGNFKVIWQELDSSLTPFSENNLELFAMDDDYGKKALFKEAFYIKSMFRLLDIFIDYAGA